MRMWVQHERCMVFLFVGTDGQFELAFSVSDEVIKMPLRAVQSLQRSTGAELLEDSCPAANEDAIAYRLSDQRKDFALFFESVPPTSGPRQLSLVSVSAEVRTISHMFSLCWSSCPPLLPAPP